MKTILCFVLILAVPCIADVIYVDDDAPNDPAPNDSSVSDPLEDGSAEHPFDAIQEGIDAAIDGDTVIVLEGTYTGTGNRDIDFNGKAITVKSQNGPEACIIDCQGTEVDPHRGFYFHSGEDANSILDGFTVTNGYGPDEDPDGDGNYTSMGGAVACIDSSPSIINCAFSGNWADHFGGGMYNNSSSPTVTGCTFTDNTASWGGGMCNWENSSPIVTGCTFSGNSAKRWWWFGGFGGGMANFYGSNPTVTNCTFSGNWADYFGGGMCNWENSSPTVTNCILWGNTASSGGNEIAMHNSSTIDVDYSDVEGGQAGIYDDLSGNTIIWGDNINADPLFVDADGLDDIFGTEDDNLRLLPDSPCIDAGDPDYIAEPDETDLDGNPRIVNGRIDMGAYEVQDPVQLLTNLIQDVINLNIETGIDNGLDAKLDTAIQALEDLNENNDTSAIKVLEAFINTVEVQSGNNISEEDADYLIASVQRIIDILNSE